jgi:hypothetical protein
MYAFEWEGMVAAGIGWIEVALLSLRIARVSVGLLEARSLILRAVWPVFV